MLPFNLLTYSHSGSKRAGLSVDGLVVDCEALVARYSEQQRRTAPPWSDSIVSIVSAWSDAEPLLCDAVEAVTGDIVAEGEARPVDEVQLCAPLVYPGAIFCAAANYVDHMKEMSGREPPNKRTTRPFFFSKSPRHTVVGPGEPVQTSLTSQELDWEAEIAVVIGSPTYRIRTDQAMSHVAGYTIINDLTLRDQGRRDDWKFGNDWFRAKSFDTAAPMGPWITPARWVQDPHDLAMKLWVNEDLKQDSSSAQMHFTIPELIAYLSEQLTLQPGDVIATGTPAGVGRPRGVYLRPGDEVCITIEGLGTLANPIVANSASEAAARPPSEADVGMSSKA